MASKKSNLGPTSIILQPFCRGKHRGNAPTTGLILRDTTQNLTEAATKFDRLQKSRALTKAGTFVCLRKFNLGRQTPKTTASKNNLFTEAVVLTQLPP